MNRDDYDPYADPDRTGGYGNLFPVPDEDERRRVLRQVTFTEAREPREVRVIEAEPSWVERMTPWLRTALANLAGLSRTVLFVVLDLAGCIVILLLLAVVWRWLT